MTCPPARVLCADDNDDTSFMLSALLGTHGYEVVRAPSISEALHAARGGHFDLFILDLHYGDGSGLDLCRELRRMKPHTPVIFYSGADFDGERERGLAAGARAYVVKPELDGLLAVVRGLCDDPNSATAEGPDAGRTERLLGDSARLWEQSGQASSRGGAVTSYVFNLSEHSAAVATSAEQ